METPSSRRRAVGIALWRARPFLVAVLSATALVAAVRVVAPPPEPTTEALVAAHDLAAGHTLTDSDLSTASIPTHLLPHGTIGELEAARGHRLTHPVPARGVLTESTLVAEGAWGDLGPGESLVAVRLADPEVAALLPEGASMRLVDATGTGAQSLTDQARLVARMPGEDSSSMWGETARASPLVVLAVPEEVATLVLDASAGGSLAVALGRGT